MSDLINASQDSGDTGAPVDVDIETSDETAGAATIERDTATTPAPARVDRMPPWKVLLHDDDDNFMEDVVEAIQELTPLTRTEAIQRMLEAHHTGCALLVRTHREHAELLSEQFESMLLTVTIEPDC